MGILKIKDIGTLQYSRFLQLYTQTKYIGGREREGGGRRERGGERERWITYSLVMKLINSETHSSTVSLASLEIFPFAGMPFFMILLILAMGKILSCSLLSELPPAWLLEPSAI